MPYPCATPARTSEPQMSESSWARNAPARDRGEPGEGAWRLPAGSALVDTVIPEAFDDALPATGLITLLGLLTAHPLPSGS